MAKNPFDVLSNLSKIPTEVSEFTQSASNLINNAQRNVQNTINQVTSIPGQITSQVQSAFNGLQSSIGNSFKGGLGGVGIGQNSGVPGMSAGPTAGPSIGGEIDKRVRLRAKSGQEQNIYGDPTKVTNPMKILLSTNGLIFPYTPTISWSQQISYSALNMVHTNQDFHFYNSTPSTQLTINGRFTAMNNWEAAYSLAAIHFLRSSTKMRFGQSDPQKGLPPPILLLSGYGDYMFNDLPVIITNYSIDLANSVDYVRVPVGGSDDYQSAESGKTSSTQSTENSGEAWVPTDMNISITVIVQNTPNRLRKEFDLDKFRNGELLGKRSKGWI